MIIRALGALGIGALAMYYFDPVSGNRRRALLRDKMEQMDLRNRAQGLVAEARGLARRRRTQVDIDLSQPQP